MGALGRRSHVAAPNLLRRDRDSQAAHVGIWELQAVSDVRNGDAPTKIGGVCQRGVVLSQGQLALDSEREPGGFKAAVS